ncbi:MAG TPA: substrate-binding domain-containing protein [Burkholderiaceae bacterium]|nr:substrate-binding domain-containing protein [Burkholderiaceae bacterium]
MNGMASIQRVCVLWAAAFLLGCWQVAADAQVQKSVSLSEARAVTDAATRVSDVWEGPKSGPRAQTGKAISLVVDDLRNGGILGVAQGIREAAREIGWSVKLFDAGGTPTGLRDAFADALAARQDGLILVGSDASDNRDSLALFAARGMPIVGWHVGPKPGPIPGTSVAMNVTTEPADVARVTALSAIADSNGKAGVVIFTDSRFGIALAKSGMMAALVRACSGCELLEVRDVPISESAVRMPIVTKELLAKYGSRWTHALAINDIYFDYAVPALTVAGIPSGRLSLVSAGDGSAPAFLRIRARSYQTGTVAEPLNLQGWQAVDELNRLFAGQPTSKFIAPVHLVTSENIEPDVGPAWVYDPANGYREAYRRIWRGR